MVYASYHVIKDILEIIEEKDLDKLQKECAKFCKRYPNDGELHELICTADSKLSEYIVSKDEKPLEGLKSKLKDLVNIRKIETSGGDKLWFKDRRP